MIATIAEPSGFEAALLTTVIVLVLGMVLVLVPMIVELRSFDRRHPQCEAEFGGLRCQRKRGHVAEHAHYERRDSGAFRWPVEPGETFPGGGR